ncbi:uncharacterized protein TNCV_254861 [Trichonephila clavipes]|nr:uncharacterized protein TNCV_254861 [Trichonephila clavipes]
MKKKDWARCLTITGIVATGRLVIRLKNKIELREDLKSRRGLAVSLEIICHNCGESTSTMSSKISNKCYDVNLRLTYGMRAIGKGGAAARIFCGLMNLPPPPAKFERHNSLFLNVLKTISEDSMNAAVHEAVIANDNNSKIAVDGTWHKRGYSSLNGVVCATPLLRTESGGTECRRVLSIFQRSETSRKASYTQYLGDGDSKGFLTIKEAKVYGNTEVEKLECVGHVQKPSVVRLSGCAIVCLLRKPKGAGLTRVGFLLPGDFLDEKIIDTHIIPCGIAEYTNRRICMTKAFGAGKLGVVSLLWDFNLLQKQCPTNEYRLS